MPIYEYQCADCEHTMEALRRISDEPLLDCPACGNPSLIKLVSVASFRLKGGGWYETDFKTGNKKGLAESESAARKGDDAGKSANGKSGNDSKAGDKDTKSAGDKDAAPKPKKDTKTTTTNAAPN